MEQGIDIGAFIRAYKRRWWLILLPAVVIAPIVTMVAYLLPPVYEATARIIVESQQIPQSLAQSTVSSDTAQRIALIEQRLMTRQNLLDIADRFDVFDNRPYMSPSDVVSAMRESTRITGVRLTGRRGPVTGVNIAFTADKPAVTAQVANEFLSLLLEQNLQARNARAVDTTQFFRDDVTRLDSELQSLERRITQFKIENQDALPDSLAFRRSELNSLETRLFERELQEADLLKQRDELQAALRDGDFGALGSTMTPEQREIERLSNELVKARSVYAESHPQVRLYVSRINALRNALERSGDAAAGEEEAATGPVEQINATIAKIDEQLARIAERRDVETTKIEELRASIERTPSVELALNTLQRDYSATQSQYRETIAKLADAETGERLEVNQQAERFEVVEQAQRPSEPVAPKRALIAAGGLIGSLGLGFGIVTLLELLNRTVRTPAEFERRFNLAPLIVVPYFASARETFLRRWAWRTIPIVAVVIVPATLFAVDRHYRPLPVLYDQVLKATGAVTLVQQFDRRFGG